MKCQVVREKLTEYQDDLLPVSEKAAVAAHLDSCASCRAEAEDLARIESRLQMLAQPEIAPELSADLHQRLATAPHPMRFWPRLAIASGALTAILSLLIWLYPAFSPRTNLHSTPPVVSGLQKTPRPRVASTNPKSASGTVLSPRISPPAPCLAVGHHHPRHDTPGSYRAFVQQSPPRPSAPVVIIVVTGVPDPPPPVSSYQAQISLPDGEKTSFEQTIKRDETGATKEIRIALANTTDLNNHIQ
jgi:hypothetical protein